jgi:HSP20 family protein
MAQINVQKAANPEDRKLPIFEDIERMTQKIRDRAFAIFAGCGFKEDQALNDWLAAEHELCWPASELLEHDQDYALSVAMAGFQPKDITVTATPHELIVHAKAEATSGDKSKSDGEQVCWSEFRSNDVYRRAELPAEIDVNKVSANYDNGMLKIVAPKCKQPAKVVPIAAAA